MILALVLMLRQGPWEQIQASWHRTEPIRSDRNGGNLPYRFTRFTARCQLAFARDGHIVPLGIREEVAQRNAVHAADLREGLQGWDHLV